jgi:AcrR family transcriptional regulator
MGRPPLQEDDNLKARLIEVAAGILDAEGSAALTMRHLAEVAGTTTTPVYSRFGSKNGILDHLFVKGFRQLVTRVASVPVSDDPIADLMAAGHEYWSFATENPALYALMFEGRGTDHEPSADAYAEAFHALDELAKFVDRAIAAGVMRPRPTHEAVMMIWAAGHGVITLSARNPLPSLAEQDELFVATLTALLRGMCDTRPDGA